MCYGMKKGTVIELVIISLALEKKGARRIYDADFATHIYFLFETFFSHHGA